MAKSPSLIALLGLLAVAGYSNRDRIGSWLDGMRAGGGDAGRAPGDDRTGAGGGFLDQIGGLFGGGSGGTQGGIGGALSDLVDGFTGRAAATSPARGSRPVRTGKPARRKWKRRSAATSSISSSRRPACRAASCSTG